MEKMKLKPLTSDFEAMPEIDYSGKLNTPVSYDNSFEDIIQGLRNPEVRRNMGDELTREIFVRAYNYTASVFPGYNRLSYICTMYAEEVKKQFLHMTLGEEYRKFFLVGLNVYGMDGRGPIRIKEPVLKINADNAEKAIEKYNEDVPLTSYYPAHVIAYKEGEGDWQLLSEWITWEQLKSMIELLTF